MQKTVQPTSVDTRELASALADGELQGAEFAQALAVLRGSEEAQRRWHDYHLVGDVLRSGAGSALGAHDPAFMARLRQRLQQEAGPPPMPAPLRHSANDGFWRWKLAAGLSSLAVVAVLGWQLTAPRQQEGWAVQLARPDTPPAPLASTEGAVMIRDPRLDQLIAAHQQLGGTSALQMPAGFLRNATFERPAR